MQLNKVLRYVINTGLFLVLLTPLIVSKSLFFPFISGKAFFFRIIVEIVLAAWLWLCWREPAARPKRSWLLFSVLGLALVVALATIFGEHPFRSFWSNFERMGGLISYLHLSAYFVILSAMFRTEKLWNWFLNSSLVVSLIICGHALAQLAGIAAISQGRIDASFGNSTYLAGYALFHFFLALYLCSRVWKNVWLRYVYILLALLEVFVIYKTTTRGTLLGVLAGLGVTALVLLVKNWRNSQVRRWGLSSLAVLIVLVGGFWFVRDSQFVKNSPTLARFASISATEATTEARLTIWQMSLRGYTEHPVLGWGPESYNLVFNKYYESKLWRQEPWFDRSHNIFLDWLIEAGALGLLVYLTLFIFALVAIWRSRRLSLTAQALFIGLLAAYLVHNFFVFDNLTSYLIFLTVLAYLNFNLNFSDQEREEKQNNYARDLASKNSALAIITPAVLVVLLGASLYYFNFRPMSVSARLIIGISPVAQNVDANQVAQSRVKIFQDIFASHTFISREAVEQFFNQVLQLSRDPNVSPEIKQTATELLLAQFQAQIAQVPDDARVHLLYGSALSALGKQAEAITELTTASALSPNKQTILFQLAAAHLEAGDKPAALATAKRAFELDERFPEARLFYALVLVYTGDLQTSDQVLAGDKDKQIDAVPADERFINAYVSARRYDLVLKLWQDKVKANPTDAQAHFSLAAAYLANGNRNQAIIELQSIAEIDPANKAQAEGLINEIRAGRNPIAQ
ncbi:MAG: O-antigen ligase family protein [Patescibacteria group bacterium]